MPSPGIRARARTELEEVRRSLEEHFREVQDLEFTIERGKLWILQMGE